MGKKIGIIGASGWLGGHLASALLEKGNSVVGFSRSSKIGNHEWRVWSGKGNVDLSGCDAVVNLAGEAIDQRWTDSSKESFYKSRVTLTEELVKNVNRQGVHYLLNASAVGYYGDRGHFLLPETEPAAENYLARLCEDWEAATNGAEAKICLLRTGVVLGKGGRAWQKMSRIFRLGIGGKLGSGQQWMPWVHLADEVGAILHTINHEITGPVNIAAPESVTNADFTKEVGKAMGRPTIFAAPRFALKLALGDFADEGLLASQRVIPEVLKNSGYKFRHAGIESALKELCSK